jgi:hypothetical protein
MSEAELRTLFETRRIDERARRLVAEYRREVWDSPTRWEVLFDGLVEEMRRLTAPLEEAAPDDLVEYVRSLGAQTPPGR